MSVASCMKKAEGFLPKEDLDLLTSIIDEYTQDGSTSTEAADRAIDELLGVVGEEYGGLVTQIQDQGGVIPVGRATSFKPKMKPVTAAVKKVMPTKEEKILFALEETIEQEASFATPRENSWWEKVEDRFMTAIVDRFHSWTKTQKAVGPVSEEMDVDTAIIRYPGMARAAVDDFRDGPMKQLKDALYESGIKIEKISKFLHARHAEEANAVLKTRNPDIPNNDARSGMTDSDAQAILLKYSGNEKMQEIGRLVDQINNEHLNQMVKDELMTAEEAAALRNTYKHYVPLHREEMDQGRGGGRGRGFDTRGNEVKIRSGSERRVDYANMIAHMEGQVEQSLVRAQKNKVSQAMFRFAEANPNPEMWSTTDLPMVARRLKDGTVTHVPEMQNDYLLSAKFNGENQYVYFKKANKHAKQIASAFKNLDSQSTGAIVKVLGQLNRYLAMINTSLSPEFMATNPLRDVQAALYNLNDTELKGMEVKVAKSIGKAMGGIKNALRGDGSKEWAKIFNEFRREGGMSGWLQSYDNVEDRMKEIKRSLRNDKTMGLKHIKGIFKAIGDYNSIAENAVRVSVYKHARDAGLSKAQAARMAKEITVNFNRRGEMAITANALYLFYNASVQGTARLLRGVANPKNHRLHKMVAATVAVAAVIDMVNRMAMEGDDEEGGKSKYDMVKDKYGDRNLIIMDWFGVTDDEEGIFFKLPLAWGFNVFHVLGQEIGGAISHSTGDFPMYKPMESVGRLVGASLEAFNPMQDGSPLQTIAPTIFDPIVRIAENKDWHGGPLYPDYDKSADNATKAFANARPLSRNIADWLAETFRDKETLKVPDIVDVSPEWIDLGWDFLTGSAGRFAADSGVMAGKLIRGEPWEYKEFPIARKVIGNIGESDFKQDFYKSYYEVLDIDKKIKKRLNEGDRVGAREMSEGVGPRLKLVNVAKKTKSILRRLKKKAYRAKLRGDSETVKRLEKKQLTYMRRYLRRYNEAVYNQD